MTKNVEKTFCGRFNLNFLECIRIWDNHTLIFFFLVLAFLIRGDKSIFISTWLIHWAQNKIICRYCIWLILYRLKFHISLFIHTGIWLFHSGTRVIWCRRWRSLVFRVIMLFCRHFCRCVIIKTRIWLFKSRTFRCRQWWCLGFRDITLFCKHFCPCWWW